jgi:hypothetical protein
MFPNPDSAIHHVEIVFADVPKSVLPYWQRFRIWRLEQRLGAHRRQLFTLTDWNTAQDQVPFIINSPAHSAAGR